MEIEEMIKDLLQNPETRDEFEALLEKNRFLNETPEEEKLNDEWMEQMDIDVVKKRE